LRTIADRVNAGFKPCVLLNCHRGIEPVAYCAYAYMSDEQSGKVAHVLAVFRSYDGYAWQRKLL